MITRNLDINQITAPQPIKQKLLELSRSISFEKQSRKGSNGWLFFGTNRISHQRVAIKFYDWSGDPTYHAEPRHLATIRSDNVIQILDASQVDNDFAYFLTPYFRNGDLDEELCRGNYGNLRAVNIARDILSGLSHLHAIALLHRDLKPQNILISDDLRGVIGDFGSVKKIPAGHQTVPGSGHSLIYRPPESVLTEQYGIPGDIYQVGVVLYQMLGGYFPYEESEWLTERELERYRAIHDGVDRQIYANGCIKEKIRRGSIINISTLPPWVCDSLRRLIRKATNSDPSKRFQSCSSFLAGITRIRNHILDWSFSNGCLTLAGITSYRVCFIPEMGHYSVQKKRASGWRQDNSFTPSTLGDLVAEVERVAR